MDLARQLGPAMNNTDLAAALNQPGTAPPTATRSTRTQQATSASTTRSATRRQPATESSPSPRPPPGLGVSVQTIKYWIDRGYLTARRGPAGLWAIPFPPDVEAACRERAARSIHQHKDIIRRPRADSEYSITETAARLGINPPRIYAWIKEGTLTARRGPGARLWITLTPETEAECRNRIAAGTATSSRKPSNAMNRRAI